MCATSGAAQPPPLYGVTPVSGSGEPVPQYVAVSDQTGNLAGYVHAGLFESGGPQPKNPAEAAEWANTFKGSIYEVFDDSGAIVGYFASRVGFVHGAEKDALVMEGYRFLTAPRPNLGPDERPTTGSKSEIPPTWP